MSDKPLCKSPVRMQRHLERLPPVPFDKQLLNAGDWVKDNLMYDEKLLCIGHEIPAKLQDGPQCGLVSLWMAGQYLSPSNAHDVFDIQEKAQELNYTRHGEMFSCLNMAKLANELFECKAHREKGSHAILTKLENMLEIIAKDQKLVLVPYDSGADQWPSTNQGDKAHWGVIFGIALIMPFKNKVFDEAKHLDGYLSYLKPPISQETIDEILKDKKETRYLLMVRQGKSKRVFLFNPRVLSESNNNLTGFSNDHKHSELFNMHGFIMPSGGIKAGLKGQLVILEKTQQQ